MRAYEDVTHLLNRLWDGDRSVEAELMPLIYQELHRLAKVFLGKERYGHTLQPTALVNEAFLRMTKSPGAGWNGRSHFFAAAANVMRRVLTDYARQRKAVKRGGANVRIDWDDGLQLTDDTEEIILQLDEALERLAQFAPRQAKVVELKFFAGLSMEEIASHLGVTARTVKRDWKVAKAWLYGELTEKNACDKPAQRGVTSRSNLPPSS
ncbi:MAG: sigma-70 family RNA polymerase sigma factor [Bryobacterales bacterium]|nr:sigma-70 family RNA polymerase sigma factor [Bryobacterales bacterium]